MPAQAGGDPDRSRSRGSLAGQRACQQLAETERYYSEQKSNPGARTRRTSSGAKHKLAQAKNSKEYMAAQRETESRRDGVASPRGGDYQAGRGHRGEEEGPGGTRPERPGVRASVAKDADLAPRAPLAEIEAKIAELRAERDKLTANVKPDVLKRYSNIRMRRGLAVVSVRNGTCQGCNMNIPPQLYNVLQRGASIETCPSCHRIIYWEEIMKDEPAATPTP